MAKKRSYTFDEVIEWAGTQQQLQAKMYPKNPDGSNVKTFKNRGGFTFAAAQRLSDISRGKFNYLTVPTTGRKLTND